VETTSARAGIDAAIAAENWPAAADQLLRFWSAARGPASAGYVVSRFEKLRGHVSLTPCRLAVLRSFTVEPIVPLARALAFEGGIDLEVRVGEFNNVTQEVLDPSSWLYAYRPDVVLIASQTRDVAPALWEGFADLSAAQVEAEVRAVTTRVGELLSTLRSRSDAHVIVHGFEAPASPANGVLDARSTAAQRDAVAAVNAALRKIAATHRNVYVLDYDALVARHGATRWTDTRKWLTVRLPIAADCLIHLAREWLRFLHPITGRVCKCLVTDLDNTLWGGVIGEDGMDGIRLDDGPAGHGFRALQRAMLDVYRRGVILAIASKNNPAEAREALAKHPGMILRPEHFTAVRINWDDKATSLREIAWELNIGIDALAFLDDNPVEREWVRGQVPQVTVLELPADPMGYADAVRDAPVLERLSLTEEDRERGRMYAEQRARAELQTSAASLEDFYRSLDMEVVVGRVTPATLPRVAQLTQKTNQFNLTTRRYTEQQIADAAADPARRIYTVHVKDRLGDNGLVGVVVAADEGDRCEIDTMLLSCRVIGRTVETAVLSAVLDDARARGRRVVRGRFIPTAKNAPARTFYEAHGFTPVRDGGAEGSVWELDLSRPHRPCPPWIRLVVGGSGDGPK
jgi:FkbH-like protein